MTRSPRQQRGMAMFVGLIMLLIITILGIATYNAAKGSLQIVGNFQQRNQARAAAQEAIEEAVSTLRLYQTPTNVIKNTCSGNNTRCVDVDGDGTNDITVKLTVNCVKRAPVRIPSLNLDSAEDRRCAIAGPQNFGVPGAETPYALCFETLWDVSADAKDDVTGANVTLAQGAAVRMSPPDAVSYCP